MPKSTTATNGCHILIDREPARDADRLEDLIADAAAAARRALAYLPQLDYDTFKPVEREVKYLADTIENRRILSGDFRTHVGILLGNLADASDRNDPDFVANLTTWLETARILSHRVDDIINAEKANVPWPLKPGPMQSHAASLLVMSGKPRNMPHQNRNKNILFPVERQNLAKLRRFV